MTIQSLFISYRREDAHKFVLNLCNELIFEAYPIEIWVDSDGIADQDDHLEVISEIAIQNAALVLVVLSAQWETSALCRQELVTALEHHKPILPILLEPKTTLPVELAQYDGLVGTADFSNGFNAGLAALFPMLEDIWFKDSPHILQMLQDDSIHAMTNRLKNKLRSVKSDNTDDTEDTDYSDDEEQWRSSFHHDQHQTSFQIPYDLACYLKQILGKEHTNGHDDNSGQDYLDINSFIVFISEIPPNAKAEAVPLPVDLIREGERLYHYGYFRLALRYFQESMELSEKADDRSTLAWAYRNIGRTYCTLGDLKPARMFLKRALHLHRKLGNRTEEGVDLDYLGVVANYFVQYEDALTCHQQALEIAREFGNTAGESNALGNIGNAYRSLKYHEQAIDFLEQAIRISREHGLRRNEGRFLSNLGRVYHAIGDIPRAVECNQEALEIAIQEGDRSGIGYRLRYLGLYCLEEDNLDQAEELFLAALRTASEIGHQRLKGRAYCSLANVYFLRGRYEEAAKCLVDANTIAGKMKVHFEEVYCRLLLGRIRLSTGNLEEALDNIIAGLEKFSNLQRDNRYRQFAEIDIEIHRRELLRSLKRHKESRYVKRKLAVDIGIDMEAIIAITDDLLIQIFNHYPKSTGTKPLIHPKKHTLPNI